MKALKLLKQLKKCFGTSEVLVQTQLDEAIKELEDFKSKSCKNCKYATLDSARYLPVHKCLVGCNGVDYDFYCNKWSAK